MDKNIAKLIKNKTNILCNFLDDLADKEDLYSSLSMRRDSKSKYKCPCCNATLNPVDNKLVEFKIDPLSESEAILLDQLEDCIQITAKAIRGIRNELVDLSD